VVVVVQHLGVEVEHLDHVVVGHVATLAGLCDSGIASCV
jgi:hypothetical protein